MDTAKIVKIIFISAVALFLALYIGIGAATAQSETVTKVLVVGGGLVCIAVGPRIWLAIPFLSNLYVPLIRGFTSVELAQFLLIGFGTLMILIRKFPLRFRFDELDFWIVMVMLCVLQVYLRNPVGLNIFGASSVGARPYFVIILALVAAIMMGNMVIKPKEIKWAMWLSILGVLVTPIVGRLRGGMMGGGGGYRGAGVTGGPAGSDRVGSFSIFSEMGARWLTSRISPIKACLNPFWGLILLVIVLMAAASGYRNSVASAGLIILLGIAYRSGFMAVGASMVMGVMFLTTLAFINLVSPLPPNIQRALSPFPGTWEERHVEAAQLSTDWRVEMWKAALFTDKYIKNKILGDGLGFTREELKQLLLLEDGAGNRDSGGLSIQQENMMLTGGYHSGPVQTIRTIGYVGLFVLLAAMIRLAVHAHREIQRCRDTEWFPAALFFGIPLVMNPIYFVFIFGTFDEGVKDLFFGIAMIKLMKYNLPLPGYAQRSRQLYVPMAVARLPEHMKNPAPVR